MPVLDRLVQFDERSRQYPIRPLLMAFGTKKPRSYTWKCDTYLDQGQEGACVGFAWAHELAARPKVRLVDETIARFGIYREAQKLDEWPGEDYSGTSVIAGAKVLQASKLIGEYRWGFGLEDAILTVGYAGPGVAGLNWYSGMFQPDSKGFIHPMGSLEGGHAILVNGVNVKEGYFRLHNSWGRDWGMGGDCFITFDEFDFLLHKQGEFCIPLLRK